jgi:quercetin dioxygenase-like cupin family protein
MRTTLSASLVLLWVIWVASAVAQSPGTPGTGAIKLNPIAATSGHGVSNATLLDRPEVRILRVDVEPGGVRNVHTHDDVTFHLFIPVSGTFDVEVQPDAPVQLGAWQPRSIKGGTPHGFKNVGTTTGTIVEVFVKK